MGNSQIALGWLVVTTCILLFFYAAYKDFEK